MSLEEHSGFFSKSHVDCGKPIKQYRNISTNGAINKKSDLQPLNEKSVQLPNMDNTIYIDPNGPLLTESDSSHINKHLLYCQIITSTTSSVITTTTPVLSVPSTSKQINISSSQISTHIQQSTSKRANTSSVNSGNIKRAAIQSKTVPSIPVSNKFDVLTERDDMEEEIDNQELEEEKVPPIYIYNEIPRNDLLNFLKEQCTHSFLIDFNNRDKQWKVMLTSSSDYRKVTAFLSSINYEYHTYGNLYNRTLSVVIRNLHPSIPEEEILEALVNQEFPVVKVSRLYRQQNPLSLVAVELKDSDKSKTIFLLKTLLYSAIQVEPCKTRPGPPQCKRCQAYGHTRNYCHRIPRCVRCLGEHLTENCESPKDSPPKCTNCKGNHTANYKQCPYYKTLISKKQAVSTTGHNNITSQPIPSSNDFPPIRHFQDVNIPTSHLSTTPNNNSSVSSYASAIKHKPNLNSSPQLNFDSFSQQLSQMITNSIQKIMEQIVPIIMSSITAALSSIFNTHTGTLKFMTWNANGLLNQRNEFIHFLQIHDIDVAAITETHLIPSKTIKIPRYRCYRYDRPTHYAAGGVAIIIKRHISHWYHSLPNISSMEVISVQCQLLHETITVISAYKPPNITFDRNEFLSLFNTSTPVILFGDLNAKNTAWGCRTLNPAGRVLYSLLSPNHLSISSPATPTYYSYNPNVLPDILDIAIHSHLPFQLFPTVLPELNSDHCPVIFTTSLNIFTDQTPQKLNYKATNWSLFHNYLTTNTPPPIKDDTSEEIERSVNELNDCISNAIQFSTPLEHRAKQTHTLILTPNLLELIREKRHLRRIWQKSRIPYYRQVLNKLARKIKSLLDEERMKSYSSYLYNLNNRDRSLWKTTRRLLRSRTSVPPLRVQDTTETITDPQEKTEKMADYFEQTFRPSFKDNSIFHNHICNRVNQPSIEAPLPVEFISPTEVTTVIKSLHNNKAPIFR